MPPPAVHAKRRTSTPATKSMMTKMPAMISAVPRSGCFMTRRNGTAVATTIGQMSAHMKGEGLRRPLK